MRQSSPAGDPLADPGLDEAVALLLAVVRRIQDALDEEAEALGLSSRQALALFHLDGPTPMRDLAGCLGCDASNVTSLADRLEAQGLLARRAGAAGTDRRIKHLVLTVEGVQVRDRLRNQLASRDVVLSALSDGQRDALLRLLRRMVEG